MHLGNFYFDFSGWKFGIDVLFSSLLNLSLNRNHILNVETAGIGIANELDDARAINQINKNQLSMVAAIENPTLKKNFFSNFFGSFRG